MRIMTGAPVPQGADAVVPVEWTDGGTGQVHITRERAERARTSVAPAATSSPGPACWPRAPGSARPSWACWPRWVATACCAARSRAWWSCRPGPSWSSPGTRSDREDQRVQQLRADRGGQGGRRARRAGRHRRGRPAQADGRHRGPAHPGRPARDHRRRQRRCVRRGEGDPRPAGHGELREGRDAAGHAAGLRHGRARTRRRSSRCRATRSARTCRSRCSCDRCSAGCSASSRCSGRPSARSAPRSCTRRRASDSSRAAGSAWRTAATSCARPAAQGSHLVNDLAHANCLIVVPEDVTEVPAGGTVTVMVLERRLT